MQTIELPAGLLGSKILRAFRDAATYQSTDECKWTAEKFDVGFLEAGIRVTPATWYKPGRIARHIGRREKWVTRRILGAEKHDLSEGEGRAEWEQLCYPHFKIQITLVPVLVDANYVEVSVQAYMITDLGLENHVYIIPYDVPAFAHLRPDYDKIIERFLENCTKIE